MVPWFGHVLDMVNIGHGLTTPQNIIKWKKEVLIVLCPTMSSMRSKSSRLSPFLFLSGKGSGEPGSRLGFHCSLLEEVYD